VKMRGKYIVATGFGLVFVLVLGLLCLREWAEVAWKERVNFRIRSIAMALEVFRQQQGHYPHKLSELLNKESQDEAGNMAVADLIKDEKEGGWPETVTYYTSSNGFVIAVSGIELPPAGWLGKCRRVERRYKAGEALGGFREDIGR